MKRLLLITALALSIAAAPAAAITSPIISIPGLLYPFGLLLGGSVPTRQVTSTTPLQISGELVVSFRGAPGSGCAAAGTCGYSGMLIWKPGPGLVYGLSYTLAGRRHNRASLVLGGLGSSPQAELYARVTRVPGGGVCADEVPSEGLSAGRRSGSDLVFSFVAALVRTRCAGPVGVDLARALPALKLPVVPVSRTRRDLHSAGSFSGHGFAGTVTSTLVVTTGRTVRSSLATGPTTPRLRTAVQALRVTAVRGGLIADVRGTPAADVCVLLDSCGLSGRITLTPAASSSGGFLEVTGPAGYPQRDFLAALHGRSGRAVRNLAAYGGVEWADGGLAAAHTTQGASCHDTAGLGVAEMGLLEMGGQLDVSYLIGPLAGRTACPGPELGTGPLMLGTVPSRALARGTFTLVLHPATRRLVDDGYTIALHGQVTLTFARGPVVEHLSAAP